jgi:hypothetical protein
MPVSIDMPFELISPEMAGMTEPVFIGAQNRETQKTVALEERCDHIFFNFFNDFMQKWVSFNVPAVCDVFASPNKGFAKQRPGLAKMWRNFGVGMGRSPATLGRGMT